MTNAGNRWSMRRFVRGFVTFVTGLSVIGLLMLLALRAATGESIWWVGLLNNFTPAYFAGVTVLFFIALLVGARRGVLLALPIVIGAVVIYGGRYLPKTITAPIAAPTLRVASANLFFGQADAALLTEWLFLRGIDVVLLQESTPEWIAAQPDALRSLFPYQVTPDEWGVGVLSRLPIEVESFALEVPVQRIHQRITLIHADRPIALYNIHLLLPVGNRGRFPAPNGGLLSFAARYDSTERDRQIATLVARLRAEPLPFIVGGDFNLSDESPLYNDLSAFMRDSFRDVGIGLGMSWVRIDALGFPPILPPLTRIDYLWHSPICWR